MLKLAEFEVLQGMQQEAAAERTARAERITVAVDAAVAREMEAARKRRARAWDKQLGRRSDGKVIRPIKPGGKRFTFSQPAMTPLKQNEMRHRMARAEEESR
jgi:hypothetical protein